MVKRWLYIILFCLVGVPITIYWIGGLLAGPYEGEHGLFGMMASIYGDALTGHLSAWILLFAPLLLVGIWIGFCQLRRIMQRWII